MNARIIETRTPEDRISAVPPEVEEAIILSFGHSVLEFEETLYVKFQMVTNGLVMTKPEFLSHLGDMEERGVLVSAMFLDRPCWILKANLQER